VGDRVILRESQSSQSRASVALADQAPKLVSGMVLPIEQRHDPTKERQFEDPVSTTP
jgi:hypothetical protein